MKNIVHVHVRQQADDEQKAHAGYVAEVPSSQSERLVSMRQLSLLEVLFSFHSAV